MASGRDFFGNLLPYEYIHDTHRCDCSGCEAPAALWYERSDWSCGGPCPAPRTFGRCAAHRPGPDDMREIEYRDWVRPALCREVPKPARLRQRFRTS